MSRFLVWFSLGSLAVLLGIELGTTYDTFSRQLALGLTSLAVIVFLLLIRRSFNERERGLLAMIALASSLGVWFDALGNFAHLYGRLLWWDKLAHGFGAAAATVLAAGLVLRLEARGRIKLTPGWHVLVAISLGMLFAVLYEISELIGDELFDLHRITDLVDTADDLRWNLVASIPAALIVVWFARRKGLLTVKTRRVF